ncbi:MAG: carboxypeptidase-like regulatory domain-containing protein [Planctomycetota bacterium]
MKKLIVVAAVLLLSIGLLSRLVPDTSTETSPVVETGRDGSSEALEDVVAELAYVAEETPARGSAESQPAAVPSAAAQAEERARLIIVVRSEAGVSVEGRSVLLSASPWMNAGDPPVARLTDAEGRVVFDGLRPSAYAVMDAHGGARDEVTLNAGEVSTLNWSLAGEVIVHGRIVDESGHPVLGAAVWVAENSETGKPVWPVGRTSSDGRFSVRSSIAAGIQAMAPGYEPSVLRAIDEMPETKSGTREVELVLDRKGSALAGRVVDGLGVGIEGAHVLVEMENPLFATTDEVGRFALPAGLPDGDHVVVTRARGMAVAVTSVHVEGAATEVEISMQRGVQITGTVLSPDGTPAAHAHVWIAPPASRWQQYGHGRRSSTRADQEGRFRLRRVLPGPMALRAQAGWSSAISQAEVLLEVPEEDLQDQDLQLSFGRTISGRVIDRSGSPVGGVVVTAFSGSERSKDVRTLDDGYFRLSSVPEPVDGSDKWRVIARTWTGASVVVLGNVGDVAPGDPDVELVVERVQAPSAIIMGRVEADISPIPGDITAILFSEGQERGSPVAFDSDSGAFSKGPLRPGTYRIEILRAGVTIATRPGLTVRADDTLDAGVIRTD